LNKLFFQNIEFVDNNIEIDLNRLIDSNFLLQYFAIWDSPKNNNHLQNTLKIIRKFYQIQKLYPVIYLIKSAEDVKFTLKNQKIGAILSIEGGEALSNSLEILEILYELGVRSIGLTWNNRNQLGDGCGDGNFAGGLSKFGRQVVKKMNQLGMIIDVSHLSKMGFWDVMELSDTPIIASHSNVYSLCHNDRNLTDDQIKMLIQKNCFLGINFFSKFLNFSGKSDIQDIVNHIEYVLNLGGEDIIGFGSDFDGNIVEFGDDIEKFLDTQHLPNGINGIQDVHKILTTLEKRGISKKIINKISHENCIRFTIKVLESVNTNLN